MERFGVFKRFGRNGRLWVGPAVDLVEAKAKMMDSAGKTGVEHFVYDFAVEQVVATSVEKSRPASSRTTYA
jgi:hypothetical protein